MRAVGAISCHNRGAGHRYRAVKNEQFLILAISAVAACGGGGGGSPPDGPQLIDAAPDVPAGCDQIVGGTHKVFLNFDGVALQPGTTSAMTNTTSLLDEAHTVPAWRPNDPARDTAIAAVICDARLTLQQFDVDVVTTRPATGPYTMIVIGGAATDLAMPAGVQALAELDCMRTRAADVAWISQYWQGNATSTEIEPRSMAQLIAGSIGIFNGVDGSTTAGDCMCGWGNLCMLQPSNICTFGAASTADPMYCSTTATQDEVGALRTAYGARH